MRTDVALVQCQPLKKRIHSSRVSLSLAHIKKAISRKGLNCTIIEPIQGNSRERTEHIIGRLRECGPRAIGMGSTASMWKTARALSEKMRLVLPDVPIVAGGYISLYPEIMDSSKIDVLFSGEEEIRAPQLFKSLVSGQSLCNIPGLLIRMGDEIVDTGIHSGRIDNLDELVPDIGDLIEDTAAGKRGYIFSSRGCTSNCGFCNIRDMLGREVRAMTSERVSQVVEDMASRGARKVTFLDDNFICMPGRLYGIVDTFRHLQARFNFQTRAIDIRRAAQEIADCRDVLEFVALGIESFSDPQLRRMDKCTTAKTNLDAIHLLHGMGLRYICYYVLLDSESSQEELKGNMETILNLPDSAMVSNGAHCDTPYYCGTLTGHYFYQNVKMDKLGNYSLNMGQIRFKRAMSMIESAEFDFEMNTTALRIKDGGCPKKLGLRYMSVSQMTAMSMFILGVESAGKQGIITEHAVIHLYNTYCDLREAMERNAETEVREKLDGLEEIAVRVIRKAKAEGWTLPPIREYNIK
jgi:pyruvate-formate lyase-activating enzyme